MSPRRPQQRRVNKHVRTLHCECGLSYTRADFYERHLQTTGHNSEFVAASHRMPDPASNSHHFYCSCGVSYTAAHAFHAHCRRTGHAGNWSRSKYQPKGHGSINAGASSDSSPVAEHAVSDGHSPELSKSNKPLPNPEPFFSDDDGVGYAIDSKEVHAINEADIQAYLLTEESHDRSSDDNEEVETDHTQVILMDSTAAPFPETRATPIIKSISLTKTIADADGSNASSRIDNDDDSGSISNSLQRLSKSFPKVRRLIHTHCNKSCITKSDPVQAGGSDRAKSSVTETSGKRQATPGQSPNGKSRRSHITLDRLRKPFDAGVRKIGKSARTFGKSVTRHKSKLGAAFLSMAVFAAAVRFLQSPPIPLDVAPTCHLDWLLDLNTSTHVVKDSEYYSNVDSVFRIDDQVAKNSDWTGTVPWYFNSGSMLLLEDVRYDAGAHTNIVSLPKLNETGMFTDFKGAGAAIYNAVDNGPVGRAMIQDNVYCLERLAPPPSATTYPSRPTVGAAPPALTLQTHSPIEPISTGSRPGVVDFISSAWVSHSTLLYLPTSMSKTTTYAPFESAPKSTPTVSKDVKGSITPNTIPPTTLQPPSTAPSSALPFNAAPDESSLQPKSSPLPVTAPKRKSSDDLDGLDEVPAKRNRFGAVVHDRIGHHLLGLWEKAANITKGPLSWSLTRAPGMPQLLVSFERGSYRILNSTSTPSSVTDSLSLITSVEEMPVETADRFEENVARYPSQWSLPSKLPGLGRRVDARDYALKKRAAKEKDEAESRLDLGKMIQEVEDHACPPCEKCEKCWLF